LFVCLFVCLLLNGTSALFNVFSILLDQYEFQASGSTLSSAAFVVLMVKIVSIFSLFAYCLMTQQYYLSY